MNIEQKLVSSVIGGLKALYGQDVPAAQVQLQKTKKEFEGHLTLVVFPFLRMSKKGPEQTAQEIGEYLQANEPSVAAFNVIKGFLNLSLSNAFWGQGLPEPDHCLLCVDRIVEWHSCGQAVRYRGCY